MTNRKTDGDANPARAAREKRLAEALRANLRRRKQAERRDVTGPDADPSTENTPAPAGNKGRGG